MNTAYGGELNWRLELTGIREQLRGECMAATTAPTKAAQTNTSAKAAQLRINRRSAAYWRVTINNPPINVMGLEMVCEFQEVIHAIEIDNDVRVVVFDSAVDGYFLNHSDFEG